MENAQTCRVLMEVRTLAAYEPVIADRVHGTDQRTRDQLEHLFAVGVTAGDWPSGVGPALQARLFVAGMYGLMAQWHLAPGSFSLEAAMATLAGQVCAGPGIRAGQDMEGAGL